MNDRPFDNPYKDSTMVKNAIFDHIMPTLSLGGWKVLCALIRQTWGGFDPTAGGENNQTTLITHNQLMEKTGIKEQNAIDGAITDCLEAGYLVRHQVGQDPQSNAPVYVYSLNSEFQLPEPASVLAFPSPEMESAFQALVSFGQEMDGETDLASTREAVMRNDVDAVLDWIETGREMTHLDMPVRFQTVVQRLLDRVPPLPANMLAPDIPGDIDLTGDDDTPPETDASSPERLWQATLGEIRRKVRKSKFKWLEPTQAIDYTGSTLTVKVPNKRTKEWLEEGQLTTMVQQTIESVAGKSVDLVFVVSE